MKYVLWVIQVLLALLFLFAGGVKLVMPIQTLEEQAHISGLFLKFIAIVEILGALGLVLPGVFKIRQGQRSHIHHNTVEVNFSIEMPFENDEDVEIDHNVLHGTVSIPKFGSSVSRPAARYTCEVGVASAPPAATQAAIRPTPEAAGS